MTTGATHRQLVYGPDGKPLTTITSARTQLLGTLLAECERGHVYQLPADVGEWLNDSSGCPRCRVLGHEPNG